MAKKETQAAAAAQQSTSPSQQPVKNNKPKAPVQENNKNNVIQMPGLCLAEGCKQKSTKANMCLEHFDWFKEGLITKEGKRPRDFDKKYYDFMRRKERRAA